MSSVIPLFRECLRDGFTPVSVLPELRTFSVTLCFNGQTHHMLVDAFKSADAISSALNDFFNGDCEMPDVMSVQAIPLDEMRAA